MGFNTVAFILNDYIADLAKAPRTTVDIIARGQYRWRGDAIRSGAPDLRQEVLGFAAANAEPPPHFQAIEVVQFHADHTQYFRAGQNSLDALRFVAKRKVDGKKCIVLELPDWAQNDDRF